MNNSELQTKHFAVLKMKYQIGQSSSGTSNDFLYLILRKADLGIQLTNLEFDWLRDQRLLRTAQIITSQQAWQQYQSEDEERLKAELLQLRTKYHVPEELELSISSPICSILYKVNTGYELTNSELKLLNDYHLIDTINLIQNSLIFSKLKAKYGAAQHSSLFPEEPLYSILKKLDKREPLSDAEAEWLLESNFGETLEIHWQQEQEREAELEFLKLKSKYQVDSHSATLNSSPLYSILKKLDSGEILQHKESTWLKQQNLGNLVEINQDRQDRRYFAELKEKYKATQHQSSDPSDHLFLILRKIEINSLKLSAEVSNQSKELANNEEFQIFEEDIQWLSEAGLTETVEIVKQIHFKTLQIKYQIVGRSTIDPFYEIMLKLEREDRLDPKQIVQLIEEGRLSRHGKIVVAYYTLEAKFYQQEYQRTGNKWNLANASSNWRKANEPEEALKVTERLNWKKVQEPKLKSALLVTRGGAFRDLDNLNEAENCATQAMECYPNGYQPYTLMGAICYDRSKYAEGDYWFEKAVDRGAKNDDIDDEIKRIVRMTKDKKKRREVAKYLFEKDSVRYKWAKSYLKIEEQ